MPFFLRYSEAILLTDGVRGSLSGLPDFRFRADDPIRSELPIEDQKSIRKGSERIFETWSRSHFVRRASGLSGGGILRAVAVAGVATALALVAPVDQGKADLGELELVASLSQGDGEIGIESQIRAAGFTTDDGEQVAEIEWAFGMVEDAFASGEQSFQLPT